MYCPKCGAQIADYSLFCDKCNSRFEVEEQKKRLDKAVENQKNVLYEHFKKPMFLWMSILATALMAMLLLDLFLALCPFANIDSLYDVFVLLFGAVLISALPMTFMVISLVGHWQGYAAKKGDNLSKAVRNMSVYDSFLRISLIIVLVTSALPCIMMMFAFGIMVLADISFVAEWETSAMSIFGFLLLVFMVVMLIVFMALIFVPCVFGFIGYSKRVKYLRALSDAAERGEYRVKKAYTGWSYALGGLSIALGILLSVMILSEGLTDTISDIESMIYALISFAFFVTAVLAGTYYILSAYWLGALHRAAQKAQEEVDAQRDRLAYLEAQTSDAMFKAFHLRQRFDNDKNTNETPDENNKSFQNNEETIEN